MVWQADTHIVKARIERHFNGSAGAWVEDKSSAKERKTLDKDFTFEQFGNRPLANTPAGGAATGSTGDTNLMNLGTNNFEYHIKGTQTIIIPVLGSGGLDVSMDQTANDGVEITQGITNYAKHAFTIGTSEAFYAKCKFSIVDVSGTDDCAFGFRKAAAYTANIDDYTDMAVLNVISGNITIETIDDNAATTSTDTTDNWADGETHTLEVYVSKAGVVTYKIDGEAPTVTAAHTIDNGDVVVPFFYFLHDTDVAGAVVLKEWEVGYQE